MSDTNWRGSSIEVDFDNVDFSHPAFIAGGFDSSITFGDTTNCLSCYQSTTRTFWFRCDSATEYGQLCTECVLKDSKSIYDNINCHKYFDTHCDGAADNTDHNHIHKIDLQLNFLKALIRSGTPFKLDGNQFFVVKDGNNIKKGNP